MRGIQGRPYLDLDEYLDIAALRRMELEIVAGIAKSKKTMGFYGKTLLHPEKHKDYRIAEDEARASADFEAIESYVKTLQEHEKPWFYKLYSGTYSSMTNVRLKASSSFLEKHRDNGAWTEDAAHFPSLVRWIHELPFAEIGRVIIFLQEHDCPVPIHFDREPLSEKHNNEFIAFRSNLGKKFFIYDAEKDEKNFVKSHSYFFNECDYHGSDPSSAMTWSIRVDGKFRSEFRKKLFGDEKASY